MSCPAVPPDKTATPAASERKSISSYSNQTGLVSKEDWVALEEPLEIRIKGRSVAVTMRTPGEDDELATGFLLSEGLIRRREDVISIAPCQTADHSGNIINVFLSPEVPVDLDRLSRHVFASSSCGLCGKASIDSVHQHFPPLDSNDAVVRPELITTLSESLRASQRTFEQTGGLHAAGIFNWCGELLVSREDVGRHNAVDKVIGYAFLSGWLPLDKHILLVSGRASFEIMQKALSARIPIVAAVSAPSSLAVDFAAESGQTLIGFLREESMNVYTHPGRLKHKSYETTHGLLHDSAPAGGA